MQRKILWVAAALVLIATPAVIGLVAFSGDDDSRRSAALIQAGPAVGYQLVFLGGTAPITASGEAIDVMSYSWGGSANATIATGSLTAGRAQFTDLQITKTLDKSSPLLATALAKGTHYPTVELRLYKAGEPPTEYMVYKLTDVLISNYQQSGSGNEIPQEQFTLAFESIQMTVKGLGVAGKGSTGDTNFVWNLATALKQ